MTDPAGKIFYEGYPSVRALNDEYKEKACDYCFKKCSNLRRCSQCKFMSYCTQECQKADWLVHKYECKKFSELSKSKPNTLKLFNDVLIRAFLRTLISVKYILKPNSIELENFNALFPYNDEMSSFSAERMKSFNSMINPLKELMGNQFLNEFSEEKNLSIFDKMNHFILEVKNNGDTMGYAIYLDLQYLKHSCDPNCEFYFEGAKIIVRTIRDLEQSEHLTVSFFEFDKSLNDAGRKLFFMNEYGFICRCEKCMPPTPTKSPKYEMAMNLEIFLPCGFTTQFKYLENQPQIFDCPVCKNHTISLKECFDMPRNKLEVARMDYEFEVDRLERMKKFKSYKELAESYV
ncbi:unnamed protein product, partial [Brachionus calyciflorus]